MVRGRLVGGLVGLVLVAGLALVPGVGVADSSGLVSEVEASRRAVASGAAVVASALTTERRLVTAYPDGSFTQELSVVPERVLGDGGWVGVDASLRVAGGRLVAKAGVEASSVSVGGSDALVRVVDAQGRFFELRWVRPLPAARVSGNRAVYPEALPGVDIVAISTEAGFATYFVVKSREGAAQLSGEVLRFRWAASPGLRLVTTPTTFQVVDAGGGTVFTAPGLAMWDSADVPVGSRGSAQVVTAGGDSRRTPVPVEVVGDSLVLHPGEALFEAPGTVFPVVVDPSLTTTDTMWAMVWSNGYTFRNSATENARVGFDGWSGQNKASRAFYRFHTAGLSGKNITGAVFTARQVHSPGFACNTATSSPGVQLYRTGGFNVDTVSWASQPGWTQHLSTSTLEAGNSGTCPTGVSQEWDATAGVKADLAAGSGTLTLGLRSANEADRMGWRQYDNTTTAWASFPKLMVTYFGNTTVPTAMRFKQGDGSNLPAGKYITTPGMHAMATVVNPEGYQAAAAVFWVTRPDGVVWSAAGSPITGTGESVLVSVPLPADGNYQVEARTCVRVTSTGGWGTCSAATSKVTIIADRTPPGPPTLGAAPGDVGVGQSWAVAVTLPVGAVGYRYRFNDALTGSATSNGPITRVLSAPGVYVLDVWARDAAGNEGPSATVTVKAVGAAALYQTHRYQLEGDGADTPGVTVGDLPHLPGVPARHLGGGTSSQFPSVSTTGDVCTVPGNKVFSPNGAPGARLVSPAAAFETDQAFTVAALVAPSSADWQVADDGGEVVYVWAVEESSSVKPDPVKTAYLMLKKKDGFVRFVAVIDGTEVVGPMVNQPVNGAPLEWSSAVLTKDTQHKVSFFVNGTTAAGGEASGKASFTATKYLGVGAVGASTRSFSGGVDEVTLFAGAMTAPMAAQWDRSARLCTRA